MSGKPNSAPSERTRVKRAAELAVYDPATIHAILDAMPLAHVGYCIDGAPYVTPTLQWRDGEQLFWHGSAASRLLEQIAGKPVSINVTLFDGMVLARSGFAHSVNYRSVTLFGVASIVADPGEKTRVLDHFMNLTFPGRLPTLRPMSAKELKATTVLSMPISEASAKVSSGPPMDVEDASWPVWAGVLPLTLTTDEPVADAKLDQAILLPDYLVRYRRSNRP